MEFSIKTGSPEKLQTAALVVGIHEPRKLSAAAAALDKAAAGQLSQVLASGDMEGKTGSTLVLHGVKGIAAQRVLLVGLGNEKELKERDYLNVVGSALKALENTGAEDAILCLPEINVKKRDIAWTTRQAVVAARATLYRFDQLKSKQDAPGKLHKLGFALAKKADLKAAEQALSEGYAIAEGQKLMRDLANLPSNLCTPTYLAEQALALGETHGLKVEVQEKADMEALGMNTLLSVAQGSAEAPKFIIFKHQGGEKKAKPVVLVGKGITFDTGGISLKPAADMDEMKYDMSGAASVFGAIKTAALLQLPINLIGVVAACENMPGGKAVKPGDIITSMSGQTVEILNTDAEGRLILCDALTYVERFDPEVVVDVATLTGACVVALGNVATGLLANDDDLADELLAAGQESFDRAWQLPLWDEYQELLKSPFADMANIGGRFGGVITAACFLARFTGKYKWAHLDIAGTSYRGNAQKGSTGRPVGLLAQFLLNRAAKAGKAKGKKKA